MIEQLRQIVGVPPVGYEKYEYIACVVILCLFLWGFVNIIKLFRG